MDACKTWPIILRPARVCKTLGVVSDFMRVPLPAAMIAIAKEGEDKLLIVCFLLGFQLFFRVAYPLGFACEKGLSIPLV